MIAAPPQIIEQDDVVRLRLPFKLTDDEFFELCQLNEMLWIEQTQEGVLEIMPPAGGETSARNVKLSAYLTSWSNHDGTGVAFDSSGGFKLPNGATRAPDSAWILRSRLAQVPLDQKDKFLPLCPDFVIELRSPSDSLKKLQDKMVEWIANGTRLGWLLDTTTRTVYVYRPVEDVQTLNAPLDVSGDPILPGFSLKLKSIWEPSF